MKSLGGRAGALPHGGIGAAGTVALHALAGLALLAGHGGRASRPLLAAYRVELIAGAPAAEPAATTAPATAAPAPTRPPTRAAATRQPARGAAARQPVAQPPAARAAAPAPATAAPAAAAPTGVAPGPGSDPATVRTEGVEFPFPGYLRNLVGQVYRRWHPPEDAALEAEVFFYVHRDGTVTGLQFVRRSGSFAFDLEAQGAVEAAARAGAFGALPAGYGADALPVSFFFSPRALR